jgi:hypothetical protein
VKKIFDFRVLIFDFALGAGALGIGLVLNGVTRLISVVSRPEPHSDQKAGRPNQKSEIKNRKCLKTFATVCA